MKIASSEQGLRKQKAKKAEKKLPSTWKQLRVMKTWKRPTRRRRFNSFGKFMTSSWRLSRSFPKWKMRVGVETVLRNTSPRRWYYAARGDSWTGRRTTRRNRQNCVCRLLNLSKALSLGIFEWAISMFYAIQKKRELSSSFHLFT